MLLQLRGKIGGPAGWYKFQPSRPVSVLSRGIRCIEKQMFFGRDEEFVLCRAIPGFIATAGRTSVRSFVKQHTSV